MPKVAQSKTTTRYLWQPTKCSIHKQIAGGINAENVYLYQSLESKTKRDKPMGQMDVRFTLCLLNELFSWLVMSTQYFAKFRIERQNNIL